MRPLVIDEVAREDLRRVRTFAEANPIPRDVLRAMRSGDYPPPGDYQEWTAKLDHGWRVVFTVEDQPMGMCRHLSVSVSSLAEGKAPNPAGVAMIARELGFALESDGFTYSRARCFPDPGVGWAAPNVIEPL